MHLFYKRLPCYSIYMMSLLANLSLFAADSSGPKANYPEALDDLVGCLVQDEDTYHGVGASRYNRFVSKVIGVMSAFSAKQEAVNPFDLFAAFEYHDLKTNQA